MGCCEKELRIALLQFFRKLLTPGASATMAVHRKVEGILLQQVLVHAPAQLALS